MVHISQITCSVGLVPSVAQLSLGAFESPGLLLVLFRVVSCVSGPGGLCFQKCNLSIFTECDSTGAASLHGLCVLVEVSVLSVLRQCKQHHMRSPSDVADHTQSTDRQTQTFLAQDTACRLWVCFFGSSFPSSLFARAVLVSCRERFRFDPYVGQKVCRAELRSTQLEKEPIKRAPKN